MRLLPINAMFRVFRKIREYYSLLGIWRLAGVLFALLLAKLSGRALLKLWSKWPLCKIHVPGIKYPVRMRIGTTDVEVLKQVLLDGEYDFLPPLDPKVIVDAGANIGLSAIFFANKFPEATIYALEPEESNFQLLKINTAPYPHIKPLKAALWNENKQINLADSWGGHCGFVTFNEGSQQEKPPQQQNLVEAMTLDALMDKTGTKAVDIFKVDIEGAEKEVFENCSKWIGRVRIVMVELHERYRPGCDKAFYEATKSFEPGITNVQTIMRLQPSV